MHFLNEGHLNFFTGDKAITLIRDRGLHPDDVTVVAGAAGGPKWLVLGPLDRALFSCWFKNRVKPVFLLGSSSGAWRFSAAAQPNPADATDRNEQPFGG